MPASESWRARGRDKPEAGCLAAEGTVSINLDSLMGIETPGPTVQGPFYAFFQEKNKICRGVCFSTENIL